MHGSLGAPESTLKQHLNRFSLFRRVHSCDRLTDRPTDRPRYSVCSNRPHLASAAMWHENIEWRRDVLGETSSMPTSGAACSWPRDRHVSCTCHAGAAAAAGQQSACHSPSDNSRLVYSPTQHTHAHMNTQL